jgi:uncharacterized membrane protein YfcA
VTGLLPMMAIGLVVGAINALAGGGTFLLYPALLLLAGLAPVTANATSSFIVLPGTVMAGLVYRNTLRNFEPRLILMLTAASLAGSAVGSVLLIKTTNSTFAGIVPWLLLLGAVVFSAAPLIRKWAIRKWGIRKWGIRRNAGGMSHHRSTAALIAGQFAIAIYGGYFGAGMGVLMVALYLLVADIGALAASGMRMYSAVVINAIAVFLFAARGAVDYKVGLPMLLTTSAGAYAGARLIQLLDEEKVRRAVLIYTWLLTGYFFIRMLPA